MSSEQRVLHGVCIFHTLQYYQVDSNIGVGAIHFFDGSENDTRKEIWFELLWSGRIRYHAAASSYSTVIGSGVIRSLTHSRMSHLN